MMMSPQQRRALLLFFGGFLIADISAWLLFGFFLWLRGRI